ncbi:MAG: peptidoglycan DD-metalloendopeptidase family protein [Peptoniphilaceae bacterium]|nr:peptidoglycan DD-metalloendopeptidase family protein [Peptoniphilaceae bacterium]
METTTRVESENGKVTASVTEASRLVQEPVDEIVVVGTKEGLATGSFMTPTVGRLSSPFGPRWGRFHYGVDLANATGTDVVAADGGVVTRAGMAGSYGNLIIIDHQNGTSTRYAHLSAFNVKVGDVVQKGQSIGKIGSTGRSTGPHLHFEVRVGGVAKNPLDFIKL